MRVRRTRELTDRRMPYAPDLSGRALDGRYELHAVIGEGAFGRVYRGLDRRLARVVAVKVIKPWWAEDPDWVGSFEREAQLLARVSDPGIVQIFDVGHAPEGLYYVSELVEGESLASRLRRGPLAPWDAAAIAEQLCRALARAHAERIIHRDVKPANILISERDQVKVGDFGVARLAEGTSDGAVATVVGTPRYMAPEQARGLPTTPATDIYSVGVVLYEMVAGQPPFTGNSAVELALRHLQDPPPALPEHTPRALADVIERALAKKPEKRFPEGGAMADALADARRSAASARGRPGGRGRTRGGRATPDPGGASSRRGAVAYVPAAVIPQARSAVGNGARAAGVAAAAAGVATPDPGNGTAGAGEPARGETEAPTSPTGLLDRPQDAVDRTRLAPRRSARRNVNPAGRRRTLALFGLVLLLIAGMVVAGILLAGRRQVSVPNLHGLSRSAVAASLRRSDLKAAYIDRYAGRPRGTAITQTPAPGRRVDGGATVRVVLSQGPKPVQVPLVVGQDSFAARSALSGQNLRSSVVPVPAPGERPGTVTRQSPAAGSLAPPRARVTLSVAETPRWRPLTSFAGDASGHSVVFRILGDQWRVVYTMSYRGSCTLFVFCSGPPHAEVVNPHNGTTLSTFDLNNGSDNTQTIRAGPGLFEIKVSPGSDQARYSIQIQDYY
ncbi:MAG: protein kinase [Actinomycetota bacterium]|nr:protein kinase [Actinomycetota bacterium]